MFQKTTLTFILFFTNQFALAQSVYLKNKGDNLKTKITTLIKTHKDRFQQYCYTRNSMDNHNLKKSIGRFENQSVDKAWFYGMRTHYPNSKIYGFQSFLYYPHLLNQSPTLLEDKLKLIPNKIIVTSNIAKSSRK